MTNTDNDPADDVTATPGLIALQALITEGGWIPLHGLTSALAFVRLWPEGSSDTLTVYSDTDAHAERTDPGGLPVWRTRAALVDVITAVRHLPQPDAPDAPRTAIPRDSTDRDM